MKISELKTNPDNPRLIKDDRFKKLVKSIQDFPKMMELRPIIIDETGMILGGNMRFKALQELKYKEIPDTWVKQSSSLTEEEKREFIIKDNVGFGENDWDILADWDKDQLIEWGMEIPVFAMQGEAVEDDYEIPDEIQTDIVLGDLFEIGKHRLLCGDSRETDKIEKLLSYEKWDLIVTDPPYNVALGNETVEQAKARNRRTDGLTIKNDKMSDEDFKQFLTDYFTTTITGSKSGAAIYVFFADMELKNFVNAFIDGGYKLSQQLIWKKQALVMGRKDYHSMHEPILYGWIEGAAHGWYSDRKQTTILEFDRPKRNGEHPTMKPVPLISYLIQNSSKSGDLIGDGFLGSGTTMVAAHQLNRKCYGMELDPKYCQVIVDRMLKLDPSIGIKKNGKPYKHEQT